MADLSFDALHDLRGRVTRGETTIESAASAHSMGELRAALALTRGQLQTLVESWTPAQLQIQPPEGTGTGEDRWSATEALTHVIATQNWYLLHMNRLIGRREYFDLMVRGLGDQARADVPKGALETDLRAATERLLGFIDTLPPDADLSAQRDSTFFGNLSLRGWVFLAVIHDLDHFAQIERLRALPAFGA